jgi:anti-anti-sigma factor
MVIEIEQTDDVCILRISGRLAAGADNEYLGARTREIKKMACRKVLADLRELQSTGSTGIGFLVDIYTSTTRYPGGRFALVAPSRHVREVLDLTRLSEIIPIVPDLAEGRALVEGREYTSKTFGH